jgi:peptide deformylase
VQRFDKAGEPFEFFLNPEIIAMLGENKPGGEGCLSVPDMRGVVSRSHHIVLRYRDVDFVEHTDTIEGFTAVIFQHEVDHLDGVLYIDKTE